MSSVTTNKEECNWSLIPLVALAVIVLVCANRNKHLMRPYLAVHVRRGDFVQSRSSTVPDLQWVSPHAYSL